MFRNINRSAAPYTLRADEHRLSRSGPAATHVDQSGSINRLTCKIIKSGGETSLSNFRHDVGGERDDRYVTTPLPERRA